MLDVLLRMFVHLAPQFFCRNSKRMKLKIIFLIKEILNLINYISQLGLWIMCCLVK